MSLAKIQSIPYGKEVIKIKNISLAFGGVKALTDVSFEVKKGEVFAIIGPNGAGKSSMLNVINVFYKPTSGQINLNPNNLDQLQPSQTGGARKIRVSLIKF